MRHSDAVEAKAIAKGAGEKFLEEMGFEKGTPEFENELYQLCKDAGVVCEEERRRTERPSKA